MSASKLLEITFFHNLRQIVNGYIRVTPESRSFLDLVFLSSRIEDYSLSIQEGISDHKMISVNILTLSSKPSDDLGSKKRLLVKNYERAEDTSILDYLEQSFIEFEIASHSETVE